MITDFNIKTISDVQLSNKKVIVRVDFDVSLDLQHQIADDTRIKQSLPTIQYLLKGTNTLLLISKLNRPTQRDKEHSLQIAADRVHEYLPDHKITLIDDFLQTDPSIFTQQKANEIFLLENIRFYPEEKKNDPDFAKKLAALGQIYVLDAFAMAHRSEASVVGIPKILPSYAGLLLEKEINAISRVIKDAKKPVVAIIGGAKTSTKLPLLYRLIEMADFLLLGGGIANTFLKSQGCPLGKSLCEDGQEEEVKKILQHAEEKQTQIILPRDSICANDETSRVSFKYDVTKIPDEMAIYDIGPETQAVFGNIIAEANTIIWNGPVGFTENELFTRGTDFLYYAITQNNHAFSLVGGGDTLAAISKQEYLEKISHISTGGGAMLEFIEKGTLPGLEALQQSTSNATNT